MALTGEQQQLVDSIEDYFKLLQKTQSNLKKCPKQRMTRGYIEAKIKCIEGYWQMFLSAHKDLVKCTPKCKRNEVTYFENDDYFLVEDLYTCLLGDLNDMLTPSQLPSNSLQVDNRTEQAVMLPRIELCHFSGCYDNWPTYRDMFISLVHNNTSLSNVQKLHYLKSSVSGEPEELLKHINVTDANYVQAWDLLTKRYGNKRMIINSLLQKLFNQKKITTPSSIQLKGILDTTTQCLNNLKNEEMPTYSWDQLIIYLVVQKLDTDTHRSWEEYAYNEDSNILPTWANMKTFLETKFRTLEMVNPAAINEKTITKSKSFHATSVEEKNTATTLNKRCSMCKEGHTLCHCKEFCSLQPDERSEFVRKHRLCYNCLISGHLVIRCRIPVSCRICNRRHHTLLHENNIYNQSDKVNIQHSDECEEEKQNVDRDDQHDVAISTHFASEKSTSLLATALVTVKDDKGHTTILRALVDQGSQANFISERAAQLLTVKRTPTKGTITGIGSTRATVKHMVQLELHSNFDDKFKLSINAYVMPTRLTSHLPSKPIASTLHAWPHLHGLTLADPSFHSPGRVDMLLGVGVCAQILKPEIIKGPPSSPCAQNTSLGWILFGKIQAQDSVEQILVMHHQFKIDDMLKTRIFTIEEEEHERIYKEMFKREKKGSYVVTPHSKRTNCNQMKEIKKIAL